jgi:AraC-like DNA-binding protein
MNAQVDNWTLLFVAAAAQGLFLFFLLLTNKKAKNNHNTLLATLILFFTFTLGYYITFWTKINESLPDFLGIAMLFTFLYGPLLLGYISKIIKGKLPKYWIWHFLPFLVVTGLLFINSGFTPTSTYTSNSWIVYFQCAQLVFYGLLTLKMSLNTNSSRWLKRVALAFNGYVLCFVAYYAMVWTGTLEIQYDYLVSFGMTAFIYFLGYHGFKAPNGLYAKPIGIKYEKSSLSEMALISIEKSLDQLMELEKVFKNGHLKLQDLADKTGISANDISQTINVRKNQKLTDYLNDLRINYSIELMHLPEYQNDKLLAVAIDAGFNNKTSFLNAFKKAHGISPSEYRKQIHLKAS